MALRTIHSVVVAVIIEGLTGQVVAYETPTHSEITNKAIDQSVLIKDPGLLEELGLVGNLDQNTFPGEVPVDEVKPVPEKSFFLRHAPLRRIIKAGAVLEDRSTNSLHHFYDPLNGGSGLTLEVFGRPVAIGKPSPEWILDPGDKDDGLKGFSQDFSYSDTLDYYYLALTGNQQPVRDVNFGLMFRGIGHLIHHIQDMAQPQHVRNDQHCDKSASSFCGPLNNPSHYEKYTDEFRDRIIASAGTYNMPDFPITGQYWDNSAGSGLAEFTLSNFISQGTNFELDSHGRLESNSRYPLPVALPGEFMTSSDLHTLLQQEAFDKDKAKKITQDLECNEPIVCRLEFIASNVFDQGVSGSKSVSVNYRASTISLLDDELRKRDLRKGITTTYNMFNFQAAYPYLISRAIAYSAGIINHFFRGRISVENVTLDEDENVVITVSNNSLPGNTFHQGRFELFYDSTSGGRKSVTALQTSNGTLPLSAGSIIELTISEPADVDAALEKPYMLVFNALDGRLGAEPGVAATLFEISIPGRIDRLHLVANECPGRVYGVWIVFAKQPKHNGQVVLTGEQSDAVFDFTSVPAGSAVFRADARWSHRYDEFSGKYLYEVTYRYQDSPADPCNSQSLGPWIDDEKVRALPSLN